MTWVIVGREYRERVRSRAFVLATVFTVVLFGVVILLPQVFGGDGGPSPVGYLPDGERTALAAERLAEVQYAEASEDDPEAVRSIEVMPIPDRTAGEAGYVEEYTGTDGQQAMRLTASGEQRTRGDTEATRTITMREFFAKFSEKFEEDILRRVFDAADADGDG